MVTAVVTFYKDDVKKITKHLPDSDFKKKLLNEDTLSKDAITDPLYYLQELDKAVKLIPETLRNKKYGRSDLEWDMPELIEQNIKAAQQAYQQIEKKILAELNEQKRLVYYFNQQKAIKEGERKKEDDEDDSVALSRKGDKDNTTIKTSEYYTVPVKPGSKEFVKLQVTEDAVKLHNYKGISGKHRSDAINTLLNMAEARYGKGAELKFDNFDERKFLEMRDRTGLSKDSRPGRDMPYYKQYRELIMKAMIAGFEVEPNVRDCLSEEDLAKVKELRGIRKEHEEKGETYKNDLKGNQPVIGKGKENNLEITPNQNPDEISTKPGMKPN